VFSIVSFSAGILAVGNARPVAGSLGIIGALIPPLVLAAGAMFCPRGAFTCGTGTLVALVYTGPAAIAFAAAAVVGVLREPPPRVGGDSRPESEEH
jgi:hypothetical protein